MGKSVPVHLDRCCVVGRMSCGVSHLPSGSAGQDLLLGLGYLCVCVFMCLLVLTDVCPCHWGWWGSVCLCLGLHTDNEHRDLPLSPSSTKLCHGDSCTQGQGWCGAN